MGVAYDGQVRMQQVLPKTGVPSKLSHGRNGHRFGGLYVATRCGDLHGQGLRFDDRWAMPSTSRADIPMISQLFCRGPGPMELHHNYAAGEDKTSRQHAQEIKLKAWFPYGCRWSLSTVGELSDLSMLNHLLDQF